MKLTILFLLSLPMFFIFLTFNFTEFIIQIWGETDCNFVLTNKSNWLSKWLFPFSKELLLFFLFSLKNIKNVYNTEKSTFILMATVALNICHHAQNITSLFIQICHLTTYSIFALFLLDLRTYYGTHSFLNKLSLI